MAVNKNDVWRSIAVSLGTLVVTILAVYFSFAATTASKGDVKELNGLVLTVKEEQDRRGPRLFTIEQWVKDQDGRLRAVEEKMTRLAVVESQMSSLERTLARLEGRLDIIGTQIEQLRVSILRGFREVSPGLPGER